MSKSKLVNLRTAVCLVHEAHRAAAGVASAPLMEARDLLTREYHAERYRRYISLRAYWLRNAVRTDLLNWEGTDSGEALPIWRERYGVEWVRAALPELPIVEAEAMRLMMERNLNWHGVRRPRRFPDPVWG